MREGKTGDDGPAVEPAGVPAAGPALVRAQAGRRCRRPARVLVLVALVVAVAAGSAGTGGEARGVLASGRAEAASGQPSTPSGGPEVYVEGGDDFFRDAVVRVVPGTTVVWKMTGRNPHTVTADDGSWDSGHLMPGDVYRVRFDRPGRYDYYCVYHGAPGGIGMAGAVIVEEPGTRGGAAPGTPGGGASGAPGSTGGQGSGEEPLPPAPPPRPVGPYHTLRVPEDYPTIQAAVDAAEPGDLILVGPGVYREEVVVTKPHLTLRGLDRNRVIIDGEFKRANGIKVLGADDVVVENMTAATTCSTASTGRACSATAART
ncbi:hypothetical protein DYI95_009215 [Thermaerobacter sp. PB12/4term]|uniref:cupredoxin domain-containing protein n=1 Tax=Thermaerobacter sp. PB12/4term TaxID=2293838 RepID=UPI0013972D9B|nr:plastocyanin/azurin family copper-binding protein [Thermaerobacter sp. PB12/4term]QIA27667.1 hypothetical protein DYI95_009215 [Thermaerobacter sp. PB12/4term]